MKITHSWPIPFACLIAIGSGYLLIDSPQNEDGLYERPRSKELRTLNDYEQISPSPRDILQRNRIPEVTSDGLGINELGPAFFSTVDVAYEKALQRQRVSQNEIAWRANREKIHLSTIWLDDEITGEAFKLIYMNDFNGGVPDFLLFAAYKSNSLEIPDSWSPKTLQNPVLQPAGRLAASLGHKLEVSEEGELSGLSLDLLNHQRRYISNYAEVLSRSNLRKSVLENIAAEEFLPKDAYDSIIELDPVSNQLAQEIEAMDSAYINEFVRLLPRRE